MMQNKNYMEKYVCAWVTSFDVYRKQKTETFSNGIMFFENVSLFWKLLDEDIHASMAVP
jgi:hypothetical protein